MSSYSPAPSSQGMTSLNRFSKYLSSNSGIVNSEVTAWVAAVIGQGSTVSSPSISAHDTFITALKTAGIRTAIKRLNTFGANSLAGAMVPLIKDVGSTLDTNHNFISADFTLASGLSSDGATKYLDTGFATNDASISSNSAHVMLCFPTEVYTATNNFDFGSSTTISNANKFAFRSNSAASVATSTLVLYYAMVNNSWASSANVKSSGFLVGVVTGATTASFYRNTTAFNETSLMDGILNSNSLYIFGRNQDGTLNAPAPARAHYGYSIGQTLTSTQVTAYHTAYNNLMTALGRTIPV